jgi:hypothetical protein
VTEHNLKAELTVTLLCAFLILNQEPYQNLSAAKDAVRSTRCWAVLHFPSNFTRALTDRAYRQAETGHEEPDKNLLNQSTIRLHADLTNRLLTALISRSIDHSLLAFLNQMMPRLGLRSALLQAPIRLEKPIYGRAPDPSGTDPLDTLRDFGLSGVLVILAYSMSFGMTVLALVDEHTGSLFERNYAAGTYDPIPTSDSRLIRV